MEPLFRPHNKLDYRSASTLHAIVSHGIFTDSDFWSFGYCVDPACESFGNSHDTIYHKCFTYPNIESRARTALVCTLFAKIINLGDNNLLATRLLMPHPRATVGPRTDSEITYVGMQPGEEIPKSDGDLFGDGSCLNPPLLRCVALVPGRSGQSREHFLARRLWSRPLSLPDFPCRRVWRFLNSCVLGGNRVNTCWRLPRCACFLSRRSQ